MFKTVLIANRGEIACRIIATCRRLGIATVAVYSDADARARHVRLADRAVRVGPAAARESYLAIDKIIAAARDQGAEAIHPGYGFLAENPEFARAVDQAGLTLIGPSAETMELMGSKAAAKAKMEPAGVPLIPGYHGSEQDDATLLARAGEVGFPLMLKAAAGGGGKGMRVVRHQDSFIEALHAARREAAGAFNDERMILERYLERPRHIEAQVFADSHGNTVHLFERDCSSQRRHQKIIEEAPAAGLDEGVRKNLLTAAVRAAEAVDYLGAGTVEFLVDGDEFFFLEMNTRLQVEHPVTELITGQDLVEWQIRIAAGQPLPLSQEQIQAQGHAMEARIYAEDPDRGFVPSSGLIHRLVFPNEAGVRIDTGVEAGDEVSMHYDPMIAKLIVHDSDRDRCRARLGRALAACHVDGPTTNLGFLQRLAAAKVFAEARIDTGLLDRDLDSVVGAAGEPPDDVLAAAACHWLGANESQAAVSGGPWAMADGWRLGAEEARTVDLECQGQRFIMQATGSAERGYRLSLDGHTLSARLTALTDHHFSLALDEQHRHLFLFIGESGRQLDICLPGRRWRLVRHARFEALAAGSGGDGRIVSPMPGKVLEVRVSKGDSVTEGQTLAVMEAMKMELAIKAPLDGRVQEVNVAPGDTLDADAPLLEISAGED
ncbi:MAG: acetyl/propionyl/methylcrotonyl-CoA carboxylase subunit alpha [Wenzhouxiangella sp.]|nr:MAG: acetyl/propionyl/methylcrotonyl-CoA carboxylase subunit alpha [Wenzhouxiangella sp.]